MEGAHEAPFRSWPRLKAWIEQAQDGRILPRQVRGGFFECNASEPVRQDLSRLLVHLLNLLLLIL